MKKYEDVFTLLYTEKPISNSVLRQLISEMYVIGYIPLIQHMKRDPKT
jgi:hypothetical protein